MTPFHPILAEIPHFLVKMRNSLAEDPSRNKLWPKRTNHGILNTDFGISFRRNKMEFTYSPQ